MIIKRRQPVAGMIQYVRKDRLVLAKRMREHFVIETMKGWEQGNAGDWLVNVAGDLWWVVADQDFKSIYKEYDPKHDCPGPCAAHRPADGEQGAPKGD